MQSLVRTQLNAGDRTPAPKSYDKKEDVPADFLANYTEKEGKWVFDPTTLDAPTRTTGEKKLLREKKALEEQLEGLKKIFGDRKPEDIAAILDAHEEGGDEGKDKKGELPKLQKLVKELTRQVEEVTGKLKEAEPYKGKYEDRELESAVREAATKAGVIPTDLKAVLKIVKGDHIRLDEKTAKPIVVDEDGDPTDQPLEKFFSEKFKKDYPKFYAAAGGSGGGSTGGNGGAPRSDGKIDVRDPKQILDNVDGIAAGKFVGKVAAA